MVGRYIQNVICKSNDHFSWWPLSVMGCQREQHDVKIIPMEMYVRFTVFFSRDFFSFLFFFPLVPLPPLTCSPYTLVLPSLRYLSWLAAPLWCREPLLHIVRLDSAFLPSPARVGAGSEPEGEESCPQPDHQAWARSRGRHGHGCQHRDRKSVV